MAQQWWESAPVVEQAPAQQGGAVEFTRPVAPTSPAEAVRLGMEGERVRIAQDEAERKRIEFEQKQAKLQKDIPSQRAEIENVIAKALRAKELSNEFFATGFMAEQAAGVGGTAAADVAALLDTIGASTAFARLQKMRDESPTGGALGNVTERELDLLKSTIASLKQSQSDEQFRRSMDDVINAYQRVLDKLPAPEGQTAPQDVTTGVTGEIAPVQAGELVMTPEDERAQAAIQQAWNATGSFDEVARVAAQFGRSFGEQEAAFLRANEGKPVNFAIDPTGRPTQAQEAMGAVIDSPVGGAAAAGALGTAGGLTAQFLDELAPVVGLTPEQVRRGQEYLQQRSPVASFVGETAGAMVPGAAAMRGARAVPMAGETAFGALYGAGSAEEGERLGGAVTGGLTGAVTGAVARRLFGGGSGGGSTSPSGGAPTGGAGGGRASVGAAATPDEVIRVAAAEELPIPVSLMRFQQTRNFAESQRARELAKNNEVGAPIREKLSEQQRRLAQNFDAFLERTGSQIWNGLESQGVRVTGALEKMAATDKARVRTLYKQAEKSADGKTVVPLADEVPIQIGDEEVSTSLVGYLNSQPMGVPSSGVTDAARQMAVRLGIVSENEAGQLVAKEPTVAALEKFRREVSGIANPADPNSIRQEGLLKRLVDAHTEPHATGAWKAAREARREVAKKYEDVSTIAQLLGTKKRTPERVIAAEKVMERLFSDGTSAANLRSLKGLLTGEGGDPQAWREVQGALVERIRNAAYPAGAAADEAGQRSVSPAALRKIVNQLDANGKLDIIFEPEVARGMRTLAEVAADIGTSPPGSVNFSNTASAWTNGLDLVLNTLMTGIPLPAGVVSNVLAPLRQRLKDKPLQKEVEKLIGETQP